MKPQTHKLKLTFIFIQRKRKVSTHVDFRTAEDIQSKIFIFLIGLIKKYIYINNIYILLIDLNKFETK